MSEIFIIFIFLFLDRIINYNNNNNIYFRIAIYEIYTNLP